jgi:aminopeptidase-like protein
LRKTVFFNGVISLTDLTIEIDQYLRRLFPICRSITGAGNRETLRILQEIAPLQIKEYLSGTPVYDWIIPKEWAVRAAYIQNKHGERLIDFKNNNLHVMSYSQPIRGEMTLDELRSHLYYREDLPDAIPYRTTYYQETWGFCLSYEQFKNLEKDEGPFEVLIDSSFNEKGSLTIGELLIKGKSEKEILLSTYICHPSMANDNLSGTLMTAFLARDLMKKADLNYSYRIIFVPETIGAIAYCAMNESEMKKIDQGLVITGVAGPGKYGYNKVLRPIILSIILLKKYFMKIL